MTAMMNFIEGSDPDDDEQTIRHRVNNHLRIMGLNDVFDRCDWYTTRPDPAVPRATAQIADYYSDRERASQAELPAAFTAEEELVSDEQQILAEVLEVDAAKLNHRTVQYLQEKFPDADLTTREELQTFFQKRLAQLVPEFDDPEMEWDGLNTQELILFYYAALQVAMEMYEEETYVDSENIHDLMEEYNAIGGEQDIAVDLIEKAAKTPLEDLDALLEAYGWDAEAEAIHYFRHRVEVVYAKLGKQLPPGWAEADDAVLMANMLYSGVEEMKAILASGETFLNPDDPDPSDWGEINNALLFLDTEPQILTGTNSQPDISLFVFVASIFFEPLDWALTTLEVIDAVSRGDIGGALGNAFLGLIPFVPGSADNILRKTDEVADLARRIDIDNVNPKMFSYGHDIDLRTLTASQIRMRNDLINRGFSEQVVKDMVSGRATLPANHRGRGKVSGELETRSDINIELQNDVTQFMADEGYLIMSLGPESTRFRTDMYEAIGYNRTTNPDLVIVHRGLDGTVEPRVFDIYSPEVSNIRRHEKTIRKKATSVTGGPGQAQRIVLNLEQTNSVDLNRLRGKFIHQPDRYLEEIIIVDVVRESADGVKVYEIVDIWTFAPSG